MKTRNLLLIGLLFFFLNACQPPAVFDKPQPVDVNSINAFPNSVQGNYLSLQDSSIVSITSSMITRSCEYENIVNISQLDSNLQLIRDSLFDIRTGESSQVSIEGDSLIWLEHHFDTLFLIDAMNVLKKYKGYYFLNIFITTDRWEVKKMEFSKKGLTIFKLNRKEDIKQLKALTATEQDTMPYHFSPTKKQFKQFIKNEGFRNSEVFKKITK